MTIDPMMRWMMEGRWPRRMEYGRISLKGRLATYSPLSMPGIRHLLGVHGDTTGREHVRHESEIISNNSALI